MIPVDITMSFMVGMALALVVREKLRNIESIFYNKYLFITLLWTALLFMQSTLLFLHHWAAWDFMYYINPDYLNPYLTIFFPSLIVAMSLFGFMLTHYLLKKGNGKLGSFILIGVVILFCAFLLLTLDRWVFHVSADCPIGNSLMVCTGWENAPWMRETPKILMNLIVAGIVDLIPLVYIFFRFWKEK